MNNSERVFWRLNRRDYQINVLFLFLLLGGLPLALVAQSTAPFNGNTQGTINSGKAEFEAAKKAYKVFNVESEEEFRKINQFREKLLKDGKTVHRFRIKKGQDIRCVDIRTQDSIKAAGLDPDKALLAPPPRMPPQNDSPPLTSQNFGLDGSLDEEGNARVCPKGSFPKLIPKLEDLYKLKKLKDMFTKYPPPAPSQDSIPVPPTSISKTSGEQTPRQSGISIPSPQAPLPSGVTEPPAPGDHEYAVFYGNYGNHWGHKASFNVWKPYVEVSGEFSLSQLWVCRGSGTDRQCVETGWQVYQGKYGDWNPHLFIFYTTNGHTAYGDNIQSYNLDYTGFVQTDESVLIGGAFTNYSTAGGTQYEYTLGFVRDTTPGQGHWWLYAGDKWIGYYPNSLFDSAGIANYATTGLSSFGGEIVNNETGGRHTKTDMGSGKFSSEGYGYAAYIRNMQYVNLSNTYQSASGTVNETDPKYYDVKLYSGSDPWNKYIYFGGPGYSPYITSLNPASSSSGGMVLINGSNFGTTIGTVKFYNNQTATIVSWSDTQIKCLVPSGATTGNITVTTSEGTSNSENSNALFTVGYPQSPHNYPNSADFTCTYTLAGSPSAIAVTFDAQTNVESGYDKIYVMNGSGVDISGSPFTGTELAGQTKNISGSTAKIRLTSDGTLNYYGFKVTNVAVGDTTPPSYPISLNATPSGWTNTSFSINWTNPSDPSGIAGAYYKLGSAPTSNSDYTGYTTDKPFTVWATQEGGQTIHVWLKDGAGNVSYGNRAWITLNYDATSPPAPSSLGASPTGWTKTNSFSISKTNPYDLSGIAGSYYKLGSAPTSNSDYSGYTTNNPFTVSATAEGGQNIYVWLQDGAGNENYVNRKSAMLYYDGTAPSNPASVTETGGAPNNTWQKTVNDPNFTWSGAADTGGSGVAGYYYYWGTDPNGTSGSYTTSSGYNPSSVGSGTYYLRVQTKDNAGNTSSWGTIFIFRYDNTAPSNPTAASEVGGATNNTWQSSVSNPNFTWSGAVDSHSGVAGYYYYWGTVSNGTSSDYTAGSGYDPPAAGNGTYYLRVQTKDNAGNTSSWATIFTFKYDGTAPSTPTSTSETHGMPKDVWQNTVSDPAFTWSGAADTGGSGLKGYSVYWGPEPDGEPGTSYEQAGASYDPPAFSSASYLRVRTFDNAGNKSEPATLFTAKYDGTAPSTPTSTSETHGITSNVWQNTVNDSSFTWSGADDTGGSGVAGYYYYWGTDPNGTSINYTNSSGYDPSSVGNGTYYLRARTKDNAGNLSSWSTIFTFKYDGTAPNSPSLNESHCGTVWTNHNTPYFSWSSPGDVGGSGIASYYGVKDGDAPVSVISPYEPAWEGEHTFKIYAVDNAGNQGGFSNVKTVKIDTEVPVSTCAALPTYEQALFTVQWSGTDTGGSGLATYDVQSKVGAGAWTDWVTNTSLTFKTYGPATDQTYYFRVRAKDNAGNVEAWPAAPDAWTTVDASSPTAPVVTSTYTAGEWITSDNSPKFNWTASDAGSGIAGYSIALDRSANFIPAMSINLTGNTTTFANIADGIWYFYARTRDNAGNWSNTASYGPVKIDVTEPSFVISPSRNPAPKGNLIITITASEQLSVIVTTVTQNGGGTITVPMKSLDNITWTGVYSVVEGYDGTANISVSGNDIPGKPGSGSGSFLVDTASPTAPSSLASPTHTENTPTSNNSPVFTWNVSDDPGGSGVAGYSYAVSQTENYNLDMTTETASASVSLSKADGTYWFHVRGVDNAGNGSPVVSYKFIVDVTSPVYITSYSKNPANAGDLALTINAGEILKAIPAPTVTVTQNGGTPVPVTVESSDNIIWTGNYTVVSGYDGTATVNITGTDLADNIGTGSSSFQADTIGPSASITLSPSNTLKTGQFTVNLTITDASAINITPVLTFTPLGQSPVSVALTGSDKTWTGQSYIESLTSTGTATFAFSSEDAAGNTGTAISAGGTFTIDTSVNGTAGGIVTNSDGSAVTIAPNTYTGGSLIVTIGTPAENRADIVEANKNTAVGSPVAGANLQREYFAYDSVTNASITSFNPSMTLVIPYPDANNDGLVDGTKIRERRLKLFWLNPAGKKWEEVPGAVADYSLNKISAHVSHFSVYTILNVSPESVIYPVPWKPGSGGKFDSANDSCGTGIIFDWLPLNAAIRIYNYQGDLIRELKLTAADNGCKAWDGKNAAGRDVASGVYLAVIKTPSGSTMIKKLAIER